MAYEFRPIPRLVPGTYPLTNVTPFTYRDGVTYERLLYMIIEKLNSTIVDFNDQNTELYSDIVEQLNDTIDSVNAALGEQTDEVDQKIAELESDVADAVLQLISNSVDLQDPVLAGIISDDESESSQALEFKFVPTVVIKPGASAPGGPAVVGDGLTDDYAAIQALVNTVAVSGTVTFIRPASGRYVVNSGTILVNKSNVTVEGVSNDGFGFHIYRETPGFVFTVRAGGVRFKGLAIRGNAADKGVGATSRGIEFLGTPSGDIDAYVNDCTFAFMYLGMSVRGRNIRVVDTLFSNSRFGMKTEPMDETYHNPATYFIRGVICNDNRFHGMGSDQTDACIVIGEDSDVRHAAFANNYFDVGDGSHFISESGDHNRIAFNNNIHRDLRSFAYNLTNITDVSIDGAVTTSGGTSLTGTVVKLENCIHGEIVGVFIRGAGASNGVFNISESSQIGFSSITVLGAAGDLFVVDSASSFINIESALARTVSGFGFKGSPASSTLNLELGRLTEVVDSTTVTNSWNESVVIQPVEMFPVTGTPELVNDQAFPTMVMRPDETGQVSAFANIPRGWNEFRVEAYWRGVADSTGNVLLGMGRLPVIDGDTYSGGEAVSNKSHAATPNTVQRTVFDPIIGREADVYGIRLVRAGLNALDTCDTDIRIISIRLVRVT